MYVLANMWFQKLMIQFFFNIDKLVYNFISMVYNLLLSIARTSIFSQADIADFAGRIYSLLAVFMIFKVTFSLIMYIVNPDDFADKSKGVSKLATNIVISLSLLILTPYIFSYAYELQTIVLEENVLAKLLMGDTKSENNYLNTAGDEMAFLTMSAFFSPNTGMKELYGCTNLIITDENGDKSVNPDCTGLDKNGVSTSNPNSLMALTNGNSYFTDTMLRNYVSGIENSSIGLMFRQDLAIATNAGNNTFIMDYKYIFSTVVGVMIILLLVSFCMDIAVRSIKLGFLQLVAPIPIISYVDPKSGKDGLFKKWYQMCFSTYISLFVRLLALYFAIYIISKVADLKMVDIIDGSYQTNTFVAIFIIIGALMFAKQLPKILEGLGIKLDGGSFTLNPIKKIEKDALGGKHIAKAMRNTAKGAAGLAIGGTLGTIGALSGAGAGRGISGAFEGAMAGFKGKKLGEIRKQQLAANTKMRKEIADGSTFLGRMGARTSGALGLATPSERIQAQIHDKDEKIKVNDNQVKNIEKQRESEKEVYAENARRAKIAQAAIGDLKTKANEKLEAGTGDIGKKYKELQSSQNSLSGKLGQTVTFKDHTGTMVTKKVTSDDIEKIDNEIQRIKNDGWKDLVSEIQSGSTTDATLKTQIGVVYKNYATSQGISDAEAERILNSGNEINAQLGSLTETIKYAEAEQTKIDEKYYDDIKKLKDENSVYEEEKRKLYEDERKAKANENAVKSGN